MTPEQYLAALDKIRAALAVALGPVVRSIFRAGLGPVRKTRVNRAAPIITDIIRDARAQIAGLTEEWMKAQAREQVHVLNPEVPEPSGYPEEAVREVLDAAIDAQLEHPRPRSVVVDAVVADFDRHAQQVGRQMVEDAVEPVDSTPDVTAEEQEQSGKEPKPTPEVPKKQPEQREQAKDRRRPVAWARGLRGPVNCAFCVMLASRGAVYKTKETASRSWEGKKYHRKCDCYPIPVYSSKDWPGKDQADLAYQFWLSSTRGHYQRDAINAFRRALYARQEAGKSLYPGYEPPRPKA